LLHILLHIMARPPQVEKHGEFAITSQFVIEVQPFIHPQQLLTVFSCVPCCQPKSLLFRPKWVWKSTSAHERVADEAGRYPMEC
jgi:hypothetical protein